MKCAVKDCENHEHQGKFVGLLCLPCHTFVSGGGGLYSQAYRNVRQMIDAAVAIEREACAAVCEAKSEHWWAKWKHQADSHAMGMSDGADECAQAIRSRT